MKALPEDVRLTLTNDNSICSSVGLVEAADKLMLPNKIQLIRLTQFNWSKPKMV